ncbi:MAG: response regulator transcription factor [Deltaproteobacteria bacterium]|nr:response regulator transcription factor [Deltaproteobacteria bacterium]
MGSNVKIKSKKKSRIFVVDDHQVLRQGLMQLINHEDDLSAIGEAGTAKEAMEGIKIQKPDLVIIDIALEGTSGLELTKNLLDLHPKLLVLILSMYDESTYMERILRVGARGYLNKREACSHIILAIHKVLEGEIYMSDKWQERLMRRFVGSGKPVEASHAASLSDRELEVLHFIGQGYATRRVAEDLHVSVKTIESHYANIKNKLDLQNSHELIGYAVKWCLSEK